MEHSVRSSGEHVGGRNGAVAVEEGAGIITHAENTCDDGPGTAGTLGSF